MFDADTVNYTLVMFWATVITGCLTLSGGGSMPGGTWLCNSRLQLGSRRHVPWDVIEVITDLHRVELLCVKSPLGSFWWLRWSLSDNGCL